MTRRYLESRIASHNRQRSLLDNSANRLAKHIKTELNRVIKAVINKMQEDGQEEIPAYEIKNHTKRIHILLYDESKRVSKASIIQTAKAMEKAGWIEHEETMPTREESMVSKTIQITRSRIIEMCLFWANRISNTTEKRLEKALQEGRKTELKVLDELLASSILNAILPENAYRAIFIGGITAHQSMQWGPQWLMEQYQEKSKRVLKKVWISQRDGRVRDAHKTADGQAVPVDSDFIVAGDPLKHPGDGSRTTLDNVQGCRCFVTYLRE